MGSNGENSGVVLKKLVVDESSYFLWTSVWMNPIVWLHSQPYIMVHPCVPMCIADIDQCLNSWT